MAEVICPNGRPYRIVHRQGPIMRVVDESDQFAFLLRLSRDRLARGWRLTDDEPQAPQRDRPRRRQPRK